MIFDIDADCPKEMATVTTAIVQEAMRQAMPCGGAGVPQAARVKISLSCTFKPLHCTLTVEF